MMKLEKLEASRHKKGRVLLFLEDGTLLKVTEQEVLDFGLHAGDVLDDTQLDALKSAADGSQSEADAAALIGRRAMSRADLEKKLRAKGASSRDAVYAAEWLEAIGALNDADYAAMLVRHCAQMGYGPARYREELRRHGIDRELWDDACAEAPPEEDLVEQYLRDRFRYGPPDEREKKRAADALMRRGFSWAEIKRGLSQWTELAAEELP